MCWAWFALMRPTEIVQAYPDLEAEDVKPALQYAAELSKGRDVPIGAVA